MTMAHVTGLRHCPNKGESGCLGVIEIGSHCFMCVYCRGNQPCSLALPCRTCKAKMLSNAAEVKLGAARAASQAITEAPSRDTPLKKRTRSKGSDPAMPNSSRTSKSKKTINHACAPKPLPSVSNVSSESSDQCFHFRVKYPKIG